MFARVAHEVSSGLRGYPIQEIVLWSLEGNATFPTFRIGQLGAYPEQLWLRGRGIFVLFTGECSSSPVLNARLDKYTFDGRLLNSTPVPNLVWPFKAALSGDGSLIAVSSEHGIEIRNTDSGLLLHSFPSQLFLVPGQRGVPTPLFWTDEGNLVVSLVGSDRPFGGPMELPPDGRLVTARNFGNDEALAGSPNVTWDPRTCTWSGVRARVQDYEIPTPRMGCYGSGQDPTQLLVDGATLNGQLYPTFLGVLVGSRH